MRFCGVRAPSCRSPPVVLSPEERRIVLMAFEEVCSYRAWTLRAAHIRTNHVHLVVDAKATPGRILGDLKAWATRRVVEAGLRPQGARLLGPPRKHAPPVARGSGRSRVLLRAS